MITCLIVAAVVHCTPSDTPRPTPQEAVKVLTSSVRAFVPAVTRDIVERDLARYRMEHQPIRDITSSMPPPTPTRPLSDPWRVTTVVTRDRGVLTWFNGVLMR